MHRILALFALLALMFAPVAPAMAAAFAPGPCTEMSGHHEAPDHAVAGHDCCTPAMPSLPDRIAAVFEPEPPTPTERIVAASILTLSRRPHIELRPPRTI